MTSSATLNLARPPTIPNLTMDDHFLLHCYPPQRGLFSAPAVAHVPPTTTAMPLSFLAATTPRKDSQPYS